MSEGADCLICHRDYGWRCKNSPDGICHYFTQPNGISVNLINGNIDNVQFKKSDNYDPEYESYDWCVYCGMPEERK